jgi:hypothetical protein
MQRLVSASMMGKVNDGSLSLSLRLGDRWVPIEQAHTMGVRVLQVIDSAKSGWLALIETAAATPPSPSE